MRNKMSAVQTDIGENKANSVENLRADRRFKDMPLPK